ncbi:hypothetical protein HZ326_21970 [Fusarium oxysporum f. sp. albedinis]|nr:hypothetical protein HZ326_21970 [Fusarium oxysporum f. sp. albedinis]
MELSGERTERDASVRSSTYNVESNLVNLPWTVKHHDKTGVFRICLMYNTIEAGVITALSIRYQIKVGGCCFVGLPFLLGVFSTSNTSQLDIKRSRKWHKLSLLYSVILSSMQRILRAAWSVTD